ncbi:helix-turn-helix transcriptional regulator [Curtobacterium flaccumfaciens]|uniref:helix-turn-helix transcriptional regulator n=1 Tax=Curtobacterium flaccumfaciens TaxID=2035 RepID=UPI001BDE8FEF|nr:helix-turn-helix transcriptional regulator [Curtobacterium flaccumfaciens]MBT1671637.1 helix-turn-helix transcriptional regulator [Curtobacterium flaccumfaciens pv. flaccumfaciens]
MSDGSTAVPDGPPRISRAVRDAVRFVQERAATHITVADIAAAVRLSPRSLQKRFQAELGQTPGVYLRAVRLEGVRRDLQAASAAPDRRTIAEIAERWQFSNAGRMAAAFRAAYGIAPSSALRSFVPEDDEDGAPSLSDRNQRRFRLVLDCEVDVDDAKAVLAGALQRAGAGPWRDYRPDGGSEDLMAFLLGNAVRTVVRETSGVTLVALDAMLRVQDEHGSYPPAELPAWRAGPPPNTPAPSGSSDTAQRVGSRDGREGAHG